MALRIASVAACAVLATALSTASVAAPPPGRGAHASGLSMPMAVNSHSVESELMSAPAAASSTLLSFW